MMPPSEAHFNGQNLAIAKQFIPAGQILQIEALGNGNINDTFLVTSDDPQLTHLVLQRINHQVFDNPITLMRNMVCVTEHIQTKLTAYPLDRPWQMTQIISTVEGKDFWLSEDGHYWRAMSFIENSVAIETLSSVDQATEVGAALGIFHRLLSDLPPEKLSDTLPGFHQTPGYLAHYQQVLATGDCKTARGLEAEIAWCQDFIAERANWCSVLETAKNQGRLPLRLMHGDPKVNNIMFDRQTQRATSVIDLDTTKPGLIHYDLGDCIRSGCNELGEETQEWQAVTFNIDYCQAIFNGYLPQCQSFLTAADYAFFNDAIRLIAFELGLRFFTDFLAGNPYFKTRYPEHNLMRALVQFQLTRSIEQQADSIQKITTLAAKP